jgi:hypothetical protein
MHTPWEIDGGIEALKVFDICFRAGKQDKNNTQVTLEYEDILRKEIMV